MLPISNDKKEIERITKKIKEAFDQKWNAQKKITELKDEIGGLAL